MNKYIDAEKLIERLEEMKRAEYENCGGVNSKTGTLQEVQELIDSFQQEQPQEENKLPNKRMRVNYAICKLQAFKPLREAIVLDDYVYDEGKCYRENLINYIHAIPENRLTEIRSYLREKGWWPYDDDADWMEQEQLDDTDWTEQKQLKVDLEKACDAYCKVCGHYHHTTPTYICRHTCDYFDEFKALLSARKEESK